MVLAGWVVPGWAQTQGGIEGLLTDGASGPATGPVNRWTTAGSVRRPSRDLARATGRRWNS